MEPLVILKNPVDLCPRASPVCLAQVIVVHLTKRDDKGLQPSLGSRTRSADSQSPALTSRTRTAIGECQVIDGSRADECKHFGREQINARSHRWSPLFWPPRPATSPAAGWP